MDHFPIRTIPYWVRHPLKVHTEPNSIIRLSSLNSCFCLAGLCNLMPLLVFDTFVPRPKVQLLCFWYFLADLAELHSFAGTGDYQPLHTICNSNPAGCTMPLMQQDRLKHTMQSVDCLEMLWILNRKLNLWGLLFAFFLPYLASSLCTKGCH